MTVDTNATAYDLELAPLPDDSVPLEAIVLIKCLDQDGNVTIELRNTDGLNPWDRVGLLTVALDVTREQAASLWRRDPDDDEDDDD